MKQLVYMSGLPSCGLDIVSSVLNNHSDINTVLSSPLFDIIRQHWSNNVAEIQTKMKRATSALMSSWIDTYEKSVIIDENKGWLRNIECLKSLDPTFKIIVVLRDLRDIYGSIENQRRKILASSDLIKDRLKYLFENEGAIGSVIQELQNIEYIPDISKHIYYLRIEDLINKPEKTTNKLLQFIGLSGSLINFDPVIYERITPLQNYIDNLIAPVLTDEILAENKWYYNKFYRDVLAAELQEDRQKEQVVSKEPMMKFHKNPETAEEKENESMIKVLEDAIKQETGQ